MDITLIIYLKSGARTSVTSHNTTLEEVETLYGSLFDGEKHCVICNREKSIEMIPASNIDFIKIYKKEKENATKN